MIEASPALHYVRSIPGMGPILAAVVLSEIDNISRFASVQKLRGFAGLSPSTNSSGGKTFQGKLLLRCNKWLRWAFVEAAWVAVGCSPYFGEFYRRKRSLGKKANSAILATARLMARITWQLLTQHRDYTNFPVERKLRCPPACGSFSRPGPVKEMKDFHKPKKPISSKETFPSRSHARLLGR